MRGSRGRFEIILCEIWKSAQDLETFWEFRGFFFQIREEWAWHDRESNGKMEDSRSRILDSGNGGSFSREAQPSAVRALRLQLSASAFDTHRG